MVQRRSRLDKHKHSLRKERDEDFPDDAKFWDNAVVWSGALLAVLCGYFLHQVQSLYENYNHASQHGHPSEMMHGQHQGRQAATSSSVLPQSRSSHLGPSQRDASITNEGRGVANIRIQRGENTDTDARMQDRVKDFVSRNEPFVCRGCLSSGWSESFWNDDASIMEVAGAESTIDVRAAKWSRSKSSQRTSDRAKLTVFKRLDTQKARQPSYKQRRMKLEEYVRSYQRQPDENEENEVNEHYYAAQIDVLQSLPDLLPKIQVSAPPAEILKAMGPMPPLSHRPLSIYWGSGPLLTPIHYDSMENMVCVVSGDASTPKKFLLYDPLHSKHFLYIDRSRYGNGVPSDLLPRELIHDIYDDDDGDSDSNNDGREDPLASLDSKYSLFRHALPMMVNLHPGDCLYIPVYWYHAVVTPQSQAKKPQRLNKKGSESPDSGPTADAAANSHLQRTISINWWRMPETSKMQFWERLFCQNRASSSEAQEDSAEYNGRYGDGHGHGYSNDAEMMTAAHAKCS